MLGAELASYRIVEPIGEGGMGMVYRAEHVLLGRPAALKLLRPELTRDPVIVSRFFNEARSATSIRHPGIVEIYDFGYHSDGRAYIVMELLQGESLQHRLRREGRLPARRALQIGRQIAGALAAAHATGIIHRDLKPDNVYLVPDPEVPGGERIKLLDFGIAKLISDQPSATHTTTGAVIGTPTYMAPEQCRGVRIDQRADFYSLGCILYEAICGTPPFVGEGAGDVLAAHIHVPPRSPRERAPDLSPVVEAFVLRLLAKQPEQRFGMAAEIIAAIDGMGGDVSSGLLPVPSMATHPGMSTLTTLSGSAGSTSSDLHAMTAEQPRSWRWTIPAAIGAMAVVGVIAFAVVAGSRKNPPRAAASGSSSATSVSSSAAPVSSSAAPVETAKAIEPPVPVPVPVPDQPAAPPAPEQPAAATIPVEIASSPSGAELSIDGTVVGTTPYRGQLPRRDGDVAVLLRLVGHDDARVRISAASPIQRSVELKVKKKARPRPAVDPDRGVNPF